MQEASITSDTSPVHSRRIATTIRREKIDFLKSLDDELARSQFRGAIKVMGSSLLLLPYVYGDQPKWRIPGLRKVEDLDTVGRGINSDVALRFIKSAATTIKASVENIDRGNFQRSFFSAQIVITVSDVQTDFRCGFELEVHPGFKLQELIPPFTHTSSSGLAWEDFRSAVSKLIARSLNTANGLGNNIARAADFKAVDLYNLYQYTDPNAGLIDLNDPDVVALIRVMTIVDGGRYGVNFDNVNLETFNGKNASSLDGFRRALEFYLVSDHGLENETFVDMMGNFQFLLEKVFGVRDGKIQLAAEE